MPVLLGDIVHYTPPAELGATVVPAMVIGVHEGIYYDLKCFLGYAQGTTDVENVLLDESGAPGTMASGGGEKGT